ncbi:lonely Cys domain-containing protein, partial [Streptomyces sp. AC154]|uniref:lonely Cys domain-containing protein n=1 Tax=Streptomyces sp. AC154 TaxID=3143184 RepID=UPI003F7D5C97
AVGRAVRRASAQLNDLATETARRGSAVKEALPASLTGAVNRVGAAAGWAATPVTWAARTSADGAAATYKWTSVAVAGASLNDQGTLATEARQGAIRPSQLISRAVQILDGVHVVEGLTLPGMAADRTMTLEIRGYLTNPRPLGSGSLYSEQDVNSGDTAGRQRAVGRVHQGTFQVTAVQAPPPPPARLVHQANPIGRYGHSRRTDDTSTVGSTTKVTHALEETGDKLWIVNDVTLLVTVKWGVRNVAGNAVGLGSFAPVTVAIDLARGVTYVAPAQSVARAAQWFQGMAGIPALTPPLPGVPLPARFVRSRQLGKAGVLSVTQLDDTTNRRERRDRLGRELTVLVENEAPGSLQPGHASYLPGVESEIARRTGPAGLRVLPGRGPGGHTRLHFIHSAFGGVRLVELTLRAEPILQTPALRVVRGRPAGEGGGLEQVDTHIPQSRATASGVTKTRQLTVNVISRYPRPGTTGRTDREGPALGLTTARTRTARTDTATEDRYWTRTALGADFELDYRVTATVRSQLVWEWPPNIPGGVFQGGLLNLSGLEGDVAQRVRTWIHRLLNGRPESTITVPVATEVRFVGSEATEPREHPGPRPPALLTRHPLGLSAADAAALGTLPFAGDVRLLPTGPTPVHEANAVPQLMQALRQVAPRLAAAWGLPANPSAEAVAVRLGELIQSGEVSLDPARTAAGLTTTMPGSWPLQGPGTAPSLEIALYNPRSASDSGDGAVDRVRRQVRTSATTSSAGSSFALNLNHQSSFGLPSGNSQLVGLTFPLLAQQPHTHTSGGNASASRFTSVRTGTAAAPADGRGTQAHETLVDTVITVTGPEGTRYVTGSLTVRLWERDVLGFGVTRPRPGPRIYDVPAMLAGQDADDLRDWARHPVTELPGVLADAIDEQDATAELWLALGPDPDGTRLARALFVGSRTAALTGRPVELVVRTDQGLRHWPFAADGSLADATEATRGAWEGIRDDIGDYLRAVRAEATARYREELTARRRPGALRALESAGRAVDTATTAHRTAELARAEAVRTAGAARSGLDGVRARIAEAEAEIARQEQAGRNARTLHDAADEEEQGLREPWRQALAEVERLEQLDETSPVTGQAAADRESALEAAEEHADAIREQGIAARDQRLRYEREFTAAREAAAEAKAALDGAREEEGPLVAELARANGDVTRTGRALLRADAALRRLTGARESIRTQVGGIERDLTEARQELSEQARRHTEAWGRLPGLVSTLETGRRAEGSGAEPSLLSSMSSAPARPTRSGRFGGQPLPAPPPQERTAAATATTDTATTAPAVAPPPASGTTVAARPSLPAAELAALAGLLPTMAGPERTARLLPLAQRDREALAADRELVAALRRGLPADEFARMAALLMVDVPAGVDLNVSAGIEARAQVARMLRSPATAERMLNEGARMIVVPKDAAMTSLEAFRTLQGESTEDARPFDTERGVQLDGHVAAAEENLLGGTTSVPGAGLHHDGYSTTTHEFAHAVHRYGLTDSQRRLITEAFVEKTRKGSFTDWPDGSLYDDSGTHRNYSSRDEFEYFAQLTNVYLSTNAGTDPYTGLPRNNGTKWVRKHEPKLLPLLRELYGPDPKGFHPWQSNPRQEEDVWAGFRAMWDTAGDALVPQPHAPVPAPGHPVGPAAATASAEARDRARAALTAPLAPLPVLSRAELTRKVREVSGREPAGRMSLERCLTLLGDLRDSLYPRGVRPAVTLDGSAIRSGAASSLVAGPGWRGVRTWGAVADAVRAAGPGAVGLVLARGQGDAPGHAWAAYHLGGADGVVWVDVSARADRQVSAFPPRVVPSEAQALVIDPAGKAVEHALPVFAQSSSTAAALLDPAPGRVYGAIGLEVERRQVFLIAGGGDLPAKLVLATAPGFKIVTDHGGVWRSADGRLHLTYPAPPPGAPKPTQSSYLIGEIVIEPMAVLPGERRQSQESALAKLGRMERALDARDEPGAAEQIPLAELFPAGDGWTTTELGDRILVGRTPVRSNLSYVQPTTGLPALGLSVLQDQVADRLPPGPFGSVDGASREFGMKTLSEVLRAFTGRQDVPEVAVPFLAVIPDVDDMWGYLRFGFAHTVARPTGVILNRGPVPFMVKNALAVASRPSLDRVLRALRPRSRHFLDEHHDGLSGSLAATLGRLMEVYQKAIAPGEPLFPGFFDATIGDVPSPREHLTSVLTGRTSEGRTVTQKQMVDMDDDQYPTLDTDDGRLAIPLVLTELRHFAYNGQLMTPEDIRRAVAELSRLSREAYLRARKYAAPLPEDVLRESIGRIVENPVVRGLAVFVQMALMAGLPRPGGGGARRLMSIEDSQRTARALGAYALGTPLPADDPVHRALRAAVDEASDAIDGLPPMHQPRLRGMVDAARGALAILSDPGQTPPVLEWRAEIVALDGTRVLLERVLTVTHRGADGRSVGLSSRPVQDWQDAHRHAYGAMPDAGGFTLVRRGPEPMESPLQPLPFGRARLVGLRGDARGAVLALSDGSDAVFDYARIVDLLFAVDGDLTAALPETAVVVAGADLAGPSAADPLEVPLPGQALSTGFDRWVWGTGSGREPVLVPGEGGAPARWQLAEGDWWVGFRREPSTAELARLAERVTGDRGRAPALRRWVRAIRLVYGPLLEDDRAAFEALLGGFWALDRVRAANGSESLLTWSDLRTAAGAYFADRGQPMPPLPVALQFLLVEAAGSVGADLELSGLQLTPRYQGVRAWDGAATPDAVGGAAPDAGMTLFGPSPEQPTTQTAPVTPAAPAVPAAVTAGFTGPDDDILSARTMIAGPAASAGSTATSGPSRGRNWKTSSVSRVLPEVRVIETRAGVVPTQVSSEAAPWPQDAYVVSAAGENGQVRLPDGRVLDAEGLADALAADPELSKLPKDVPVVLAVPFAGAQYQRTLRTVADRLGRRVWGPSGDGRLIADGSGDAHVVVMVDRDPDAPIGLWISVDPSDNTSYEDRQWTALDGTVFRDSDVDTRPLADDSHQRYGRLAVAKGDALRAREERFRIFRKMRRLVHRTHADTGYQDTGTEPVSMASAVYLFAAHGYPGRMRLPLLDGRTVLLDKRDAAAYITGLREVRELPPGHRMHLEICWSATDGDPRQQQRSYAPAPHIDDPLDDLSLIGHVANLSRMETEGSTRQTGMDNTMRVALEGADGERGRRVVARPEPLDPELDQLAREAGLHHGTGEVSPEVRATTLRLVRALRLVFGNEIEDHRGVAGGRYERVLKGIGALERMRANDPAISALTSFRMDMWAFFVQEHSGKAPAPAGYVALLDFAAARIAADPDARLTEEIPAPVVELTLKHMSENGMDKMRYVQSLPPGAPSTARHAASTLWAMTRAAQIFRSMPPADRETMGRKVLHLEVNAVWDRAGQETLWKLTAKAIAEGADASDHDLLAARHLREIGAFAPAALLRQGPNVQGVNWSGTPAPAGIDWARVRRIAHGPNGTVTQPVQPVWTGPGLPMPLLSVVEVDWAGSLVLHLPGRAPVEVSEGEFLALMAMDPALGTLPLNTPVLFLTTGPGELPAGLLQRFSQRTGRPAYGYDAPMMLNAPDAATPLVILALLDPATKNPGQWTGTVRQFAAPGTTTDAALTLFGTAAATSAPREAEPLPGPEGAAPDPSWPAPQARRESGVGTFHFAPGTVPDGPVRTGTAPGESDERPG